MAANELVVPNNMRVGGNLRVDGDMPVTARSNLVQDAAAEYAVPLVLLRVHDALHTNLPGTSATDDLALSGGTFGTDSPKITTGDVKASTVTRYARFQFELPPEYDGGETVTLRMHAGMETTVADTSATIDVECYKSDREAGIGSDICGTAAQSINSLTLADKDFSITPSGLAAGDVLDIRLTVAVTDSSTGTAVIASIGAVEMLLDIKG
jgi:hypothetical protein